MKWNRYAKSPEEMIPRHDRSQNGGMTQRNIKDCPHPKVRRVATNGSLEKGCPEAQAGGTPLIVETVPLSGGTADLARTPVDAKLHPC